MVTTSAPWSYAPWSSAPWSSARLLARECSIALLVVATMSASIGAQTSEPGSIKPKSGEGDMSIQDRVYAMELRTQSESTPESRQYKSQYRSEDWQAKDMAVIVCDMWDSHHCLNAVRRVGEVAPRMNALIEQLRSGGATIIHAPSGCMDFYKQHPSRQRAKSVTVAENVPKDISKWVDQIASEAQCPYPLDQSAGGEDDDPVEHAQWAASLQAAGRNPRAPWLKQTDAISIDQDSDWISDSGPEIWSILESRGVKNIALLGVHTNMCVLGRPFGLRQLASHGKHVVLFRDLTDTMYDPNQWPYVNHFSGTDLIIDHIERFVCPTVTSNSILGGTEFRFADDRRPVLAIIMAEDEYATAESLPAFAAAYLGNYRVHRYFGHQGDHAGHQDDKSSIPGIERIDQADAILVSVRRHPLPAEQLKAVRQFVASGKPVIGIRTASHAFSLRSGAASEGLEQWPEFDAQVFGGSYTNHYANDLLPEIVFEPAGAASAPVAASPLPASPLSASLAVEPFVSQGSLYQVAPLSPAAHVLAQGSVTGKPSEPVAWTFVRSDGGRSFYTSLGHKGDFDESAFRLLLVNGIHWACGQPLQTLEAVEQQHVRYAAGRGKQR